MYVPWWGIVVLIGLLLYLIATDIYLHRRVMRLEKTVRKLEGMNNGQSRGEEHENLM